MSRSFLFAASVTRSVIKFYDGDDAVLQFLCGLHKGCSHIMTRSDLFICRRESSESRARVERESSAVLGTTKLSNVTRVLVLLYINFFLVSLYSYCNYGSNC